MIKRTIAIQKTARYFVSNGITAETQHVWFVCHGYGQLANYFLKNFVSLESPAHVVIAPEGLHRFYWEKFSGRVVASWMTKEDREDDIRDYVGFLDQVHDEVLQHCDRKKIRIHVLGFSQGTATVCRWLAYGRCVADTLILWAGHFPGDIVPAADLNIFRNMQIFLAAGDQDEFVSEADIRNQVEFLDENNLSHELVRFKGKHEITTEGLEKIVERL